MEIEINGARSPYANCICTCCHNTGEVVMIDIPTTKYDKKGLLKANYDQIWLCDDCRNKLLLALGVEE